MTDKDLAALSDADKAILFLYLCEKGLPPWATGENQWKALAALTGWDERTTIEALDTNVERGLAGKLPDPPLVREVHNAWAVYGLEEDGSEAETPLACWGRPQDWGDPRWHYECFTFVWETAPDGARYINHCHCYTDLKREPGEYAELFSSLVAQILMPGQAPQLCGRKYLAEEDFWSRKWGKRPPVFREEEESWDGDEGP